MRLQATVACSAEELAERLRDGVRTGQSFRTLRAHLVDFAAGGGRRDAAGAVLEALCVELEGRTVLFDLLDVACGFCAPRYRVWTDDCYRRRSRPAPQLR
jgi:hypothetical protein